jgi:CDP-diacylglycerol--serine O-phosphatidyltransferase
LALTVVCGLLMVSRFRYASFKGSGQPKEREDRIPFGMALVVVAVLVALFIDPPRVLLLVAGSYAISGPLYWLWLKLKPKSTAA